MSAEALEPPDQQEPALSQRDALRAATTALARAGWELKTAEIDLVGNRARIEVSRGSRHVTLDVQNGAASVTREELEHVLVAVGRRGDRYMAERIRPRLLGREKFEAGAVQDALRFFSDYLEDNGTGELVGGEAWILLT